MNVDKYEMMDSLKEMQKQVDGLKDSIYYLKKIIDMIDVSINEQTGKLTALYRLRDEYFETFEDFGEENLSILSDIELDNWNVINDEIELLESPTEEVKLKSLYQDAIILLNSDLIKLKDQAYEGGSTIRENELKLLDDQTIKIKRKPKKLRRDRLIGMYGLPDKKKTKLVNSQNKKDFLMTITVFLSVFFLWALAMYYVGNVWSMIFAIALFIPIIGMIKLVMKKEHRTAPLGD